MKRLVVFLGLVALIAGAGLAAPAKKPKLILTIVIDQFRYDYLTRFRADYTSGLARLLDHGAVFTSAYYEHFPALTAVGHSTILSGATPSISGIISNEWIDRDTAKEITSVSDLNTKLLGGLPGAVGSSPNRMLVSTIGDELKMSNGGQTKGIGVSGKDRSAILPLGRTANGAFWFDPNTGNFVSSTYYGEALPQWAVKYNSGRVADKFLGRGWLPFDAKSGAKVFTTLPADAGKKFYEALEKTPYANEMIEQFAEAALEGEKLGRGPATDVLTVSFSANDRVGHTTGPDRPEVRDISIQTDRIIGRLMQFAESKVGVGNVLVVLTADHGVAPTPEQSALRHMPGGIIPMALVTQKLQSALTAKYGDGDWLLMKKGYQVVFLDHKLIAAKNLSEADVQDTAAQALRTIPHVARAYTRSHLLEGIPMVDIVDRRIARGFHAQRSADLYVVLEPYWLFSSSDSSTSHTSPYNYDMHVPLIFMGPGVKPGRYNAKIEVNDIAPTLANMLDVETPSGSVGRVLDEMIEK